MSNAEQAGKPHGFATRCAVLVWSARALAAGLWLGVAGRNAMRLVAVEATLPPGFSVGGSLEVVASGMLIGMPFALAFWGARAIWPLPHASGVAAGLLLFALVAVIQPPAARSALAASPDSNAAAGVLFAAVFASYGGLLDLVAHWDSRRRGPLA